MILAGLDAATTSGMGIMDGDALVHAEAHRPRGDTDAEIFDGFRLWFRNMLIQHNVEAVAIEQPLPTDFQGAQRPGQPKPGWSNMHTFLRLYGLRAHALQIAFSLNVPAYEVNQAVWRKGFLGFGRKDKNEDWKALSLRQCKLLGWPVNHPDAAEACGVVWWLGGHLRVAQRIRPDDLFAAR